MDVSASASADAALPVDCDARGLFSTNIPDAGSNPSSGTGPGADHPNSSSKPSSAKAASMISCSWNCVAYANRTSAFWPLKGRIAFFSLSKFWGRLSRSARDCVITTSLSNSSALAFTRFAISSASPAESFAVPALRIADAASSSAAVILSDSWARSSASTSDTFPSKYVSATMPKTIMIRPAAAKGIIQDFFCPWVSSCSSPLNLSNHQRLIITNVSGASKTHPNATAYPEYLTSRNQNALLVSSANRTLSTASTEPFQKIRERRERDTNRFLMFIGIMFSVLVCEAVYVFCFRKV